MLSAAYKCELGEKIALTDFTKRNDSSSGLKDKPVLVYDLFSDFDALILLFVHKYFGTCISIIELWILFPNGIRDRQMPH